MLPFDNDSPNWARTARRVVLLSAAATLLGSLVWANEQEPTTAGRASTGSVVTVDDEPEEPAVPPVIAEGCRVKILDQRTLASDRPGVLAFVGFREESDEGAVSVESNVKDLEEGDLVSSGQFVIGLRDEVVRAARAVAHKRADNHVNIEYAGLEWEVAKLERDKALATNQIVPNAVSEIEIERLKLAADRGELSVEQAVMQEEIAKKEAEQADAEWRTYRVASPVDGIVTRIHRRPGEAVRQGDPIIDVVDTSRLRVEGYIKLTDSFRVRRGQPVKVTLELPPGVDLPQAKETFEGTIRFVDVEVQKIDGTVRFWAEVRNENGWLRSGLTATVTIEVGEEATAKVAGR